MTRYNSTIKVKCKCSPECEKVPTFSCYGYYYAHLPEKLKEKAGTRRKVQIKNRNKRNAITRKLYKTQDEGDQSEAWKSKLWFAARRFQMTGTCVVCGEKTCKDADNFKNSIAHLFGKRDLAFPSIKWHPENWIELCFWNNSHHTNFDNCMLTFDDLKETPAWIEIVRKTNILYPLMTIREQGRVPEVLIQELLPVDHIMTSQSPNNQNSENNKSKDADNFTINWSNVFTKKVEDKIKNSDNYKNNE